MPFAPGWRAMRQSINLYGVSRLLIIIAAIGIAERAPATTFVLIDERALAARSDAAVLGTVSGVRGETGPDGAVVTRIALAPEQVLLGTLPDGPVIVQDRGGTVGGRTERIFGSAEYRVGERVLAFLTRGADGALHTTAMAMGKYDVDDGVAGGDARVTRAVGADVALFDPVTGRLEPGGALDSERLAAFVGRLQKLAPTSARPPRQRVSTVRPAPLRAPAFTYLGAPSRWFEPDDAIPIRFRIDGGGDAALGAAASVGAAVDALAAWSEVPGISLKLVDG